MTPFLTEPITFSAGRRWLEQKVNLPLELSSREISNQIPARIRGEAFFSAQVAGAHILEGLRGPLEMVGRGEIGVGRCVEMYKEFLSKQGVGIPAPGEKGERDLRNLGSTARLELIVRQNVAMAHAVGQREVAEHPAVVEMFPNYEYSAVMDAHTRDEHAAFDGLILPKDDPFWAAHYPPWEFNCRCMVFDTDVDPNGQTATPQKNDDGTDAPLRVDYNGRMLEAGPAASGFEFESSPGAAFENPDFGSIKDDALRAHVEQAWKQSPWAPAAAAPVARFVAPFDRPVTVEERAAQEAAAAVQSGPISVGASDDIPPPIYPKDFTPAPDFEQARLRLVAAVHASDVTFEPHPQYGTRYTGPHDPALLRKMNDALAELERLQHAFPNVRFAADRIALVRSGGGYVDKAIGQPITVAFGDEWSPAMSAHYMAEMRRTSIPGTANWANEFRQHTAYTVRHEMVHAKVDNEALRIWQQETKDVSLEHFRTRISGYDWYRPCEQVAESGSLFLCPEYNRRTMHPEIVTALRKIGIAG